jgi:hypothetical protein
MICNKKFELASSMSAENLFYPKEDFGTLIWEYEQNEFVFGNYGSYDISVRNRHR